jgi:hypothetical protein
LDRAILAGVRANIEHYNALRALTSADARPTPENQQVHQDTADAVVELQRVDRTASCHRSARARTEEFPEVALVELRSNSASADAVGIPAR